MESEDIFFIIEIAEDASAPVFASILLIPEATEL